MWLRGFGIASRLSRERQSAEPPESVAGTLAYMAPEQTGRMNRSIDSRSDLYSFGVSLYEMLTGSLPFTASDPMEWVHCHIARQPIPPQERRKNVPAPVSAIIMKLLAKTAEERYQTAAGVESDLRRCLVEWETQSRIDQFALGEHDTPDRLLVPEKLYGRGREIDTLLASFDRVLASGRPELVLVTDTPVSASPPWSMKSTRGWFRPVASLLRGSSSSTNATSRMRVSHKPSRAWSARYWARARRSSASGEMPFARRWVRMVSSW